MKTRFIPTAVVSVVVVALPTIVAVLSASTTSLRDRFDHFELALANYLPLLFPLLMALLYAPVVAQETAHNYLSPAQARQGRTRYVLGHVVRAATLGFIVMMASVSVAWLYTMYIAPTGLTYQPQADSLDPSVRSTFTRFIAISPTVYFLATAVWSGLQGAIFAVAAVACVMLIGNRLVALSAPFVVTFVLNFIFATLRLERWSPLNAVFPDSLTQGPLLIPLVVGSAVGVMVAFSVRLALRRDVVPHGLT